MGIRANVRGRVGPVWISVGVGTLLLSVCCLAVPIIGMVNDTANDIRTYGVNWSYLIPVGIGVALLAGFVWFAFWWNSPSRRR